MHIFIILLYEHIKYLSTPNHPKTAEATAAPAD
jgi:hypothetical protein